MESDIWRDQREFNTLLRPYTPDTYAERTALTKEMVLHLISECDELLRASGAWKPHRKEIVLENRPQILAELTDIRKYWITVAQIWGFTEDEVDKMYWLKSASVRQRYVEEWVNQLIGPVVILDLDNVLCDYPLGFIQWVQQSKWKDMLGVDEAAQAYLGKGYEWINARNLGCSEEVWADMKHAFRTSASKRTLPMRPKAAEFTRWCRDQGWAVIILTSRPIDRYPSLYDDTLYWLSSNSFAYDYIWWGFDKAHAINVRHIASQVVFTVDDEEQFVRQYLSIGVRTYWMMRAPVPPSNPLLDGDRLIVVTSLQSIMEKEKERAHTD
jgi:hypothetical protein